MTGAVIVTTPEELAALVRAAVAEALRELQPAPAPNPTPGLDPKKFYSVQEFAELARVDVKTIYDGVNAGTIPAHRYGARKAIRIPETSLAAMGGQG